MYPLEWDKRGGSSPKRYTPASVENTPGASQHWFAIRVKSRCEKVVATIAHNKGFEEFLPLYQSRRRWSDRLKSLDIPLFPGYVFCRMDPRYRLPLLTIPGVVQFVGIGKTPVPIDDGEIASIQAAVRSGLAVEPCGFLELGQRVRVQTGPLAGTEGIFVEASKRERIVVSVTLLKRSVAVSIEPHWAVPLDTCEERTAPFKRYPVES
jgi:transcription antitermination factor NusG